MELVTEIDIAASASEVWAVITDIDGASSTISAIERIEVIERPNSGLVGLKWRETRTMFGRSADETMWVVEAQEPEFYRTRAESHGAVYASELRLTPRNGKTMLRMSFGAKPQTFFARIMWVLTGWLARSSTRKALEADLRDIREAVERRSVHGEFRQV